MNSELRVLIVDDEQVCIDALKFNLKSYDYVNVVSELTNSADVISFLQKNKVDLIFLDVQMPGISGFDLAEHIKRMYQGISIIFVTGHVEFALEGYDYNPADFLVKPINVLRLDKALSAVNALKHGTNKQNSKIGVQVDGGFKIINVDDIDYIEKRGRKICIVCRGNNIYYSREPLQKLEMIFEDYNFFRTHQSFLVPLNKIRGIHIDEYRRSYNINIENVSELLPMSRDKYSELKEILIKKGIKFY